MTFAPNPKYAAIWMTCSTPAGGDKMRLLPTHLAIGLFTYGRAGRNVLTQYEIDALSCVEGSLQEVRGFIAYLGERLEDRLALADVAVELEMIRTSLAEMLEDPKFRAVLEEAWASYTDFMREELSTGAT